MTKHWPQWAAIGALMVSGIAAAGSRQLISEEDVPIYLSDVKKIACRDRIPDHGFGPLPGLLSIPSPALFDRTLRIGNVEALYVHIPDTVSCASLKPQLDTLPASLTVHRKLERVVKESLDRKRNISTLVGTLTLTLPAQIDGRPIVLQSEQRWLEENGPASDTAVGNKPFPLVHAFNALTHPQSGTSTVGLFCKPAFEGAEETELTLGELSGFSDLGGTHSNSDRLNRRVKPADCPDLRASLLEAITAEDPGNWGTILKVNRKVELRHRYILDNQANSTCQEIELETVSTDLRGETFRAAAAFPLRTVPLKDCLPAQK